METGWQMDEEGNPVSRSYRTYEEWKQTTINAISTAIKGSYRTYEEWKHRCVDKELE